jgi:hypothetical protein
MTSCANCSDLAVYLVKNAGAEDQVFCEKHLPWFINRRALGDKVQKLDLVPAPKSEVIEEPFVPPVEEPAKETKKASKKKAEKTVVDTTEVQVEDRADSDETSTPVSSESDETDGSVSSGASEPA